MSLCFLVLGCGYTGTRVAKGLATLGHRVLATTRDPGRLSVSAADGIEVLRLDVLDPATLTRLAAARRDGMRVLHSIPVIEAGGRWMEPTPLLLEALAGSPSRIVYLSTTGVYGRAFDVDETTPAAPASEGTRLRVAAEELIASGPWSSLILRPAAIYGPGRGVHESIRSGRYRLPGDGGNYVSRIHVDDLAALSLAALQSELTGTYPVADEEPCTSLEMASYCAGLVGREMPQSTPADQVHPTRRANRRVDGTAICRKLEVTLRYRSYRAGVPAALQAASD